MSIQTSLMKSLTVDKEFSRLHSFEVKAETGFSKQVHIQKSERVRNEWDQV